MDEDRGDLAEFEKKRNTDYDFSPQCGRKITKKNSLLQYRRTSRIEESVAPRSRMLSKAKLVHRTVDISTLYVTEVTEELLKF